MKNLYKSFLFIAMLYALLSMLSFAITFGARHSPVAPMAKINKMMNHEIDPEMIVFGASTAWVNLNPEIIGTMTGLSVFNMGMEGTPLPEYKGIAEEFIHYSKKCRYCIIVLNLWEFSEREGLYQPSKFYPYIENDNIYNALYALQPRFAWEMRHVPFFRLTTYAKPFYRWVEAGWRAAAGKEIAINEKNGFFPSPRTWDTAQVRKNREGKDIFIEIDRKRVAMFRSLESQCVDKGFVVITVIPPVQLDGQDLIRNMGEVKETILNAIPLRSIFLDYTKNDICNDKRYFFNNTHLNAIGADYFSEIFSHDFMRLTGAEKK